MAIKFDVPATDPSGGLVASMTPWQTQNADLRPQRQSQVPGLSDPNSVADGNLPMDPIVGLESNAVEKLPYKNLNTKR